MRAERPFKNSHRSQVIQVLSKPIQLNHLVPAIFNYSFESVVCHTEKLVDSAYSVRYAWE